MLMSPTSPSPAISFQPHALQPLFHCGQQIESNHNDVAGKVLSTCGVTRCPRRLTAPERRKLLATLASLLPRISRWSSPPVYLVHQYRGDAQRRHKADEHGASLTVSMAGSGTWSWYGRHRLRDGARQQKRQIACRTCAHNCAEGLTASESGKLSPGSSGRDKLQGDI